MYYLLIIIQRICDQMQKIKNSKKNFNQQVYSSVILKTVLDVPFTLRVNQCNFSKQWHF